MDKILTGRIEVDGAQLREPPDMRQPVTLTVGDETREYRIVKAELNYDRTWDLVLEPTRK